MFTIFAQAAANPPSMDDWQKLAVIYGPFLAGVGILLKMHRDFVYVTIPSALKAIRREIRRSSEKHQEMLDTLLDLECCRDCSDVKEAKKRRRLIPQPAGKPGKRRRRKPPT